MNDTRKKIILKEIHFWKQNKMLPEQYCNYLIALYSEGEDDQPFLYEKRKWLNQSELYFSLLFLMLIIISIVITYITDFPIEMQTLFLAVFVFILLLSWRFFRKKGKNPLVIFITGAFLLLLYTVQLNDAFFASKASSLYMMLLLNSFIWLTAGIWRRVPFFILSGAIATLALMFLIFR